MKMYRISYPVDGEAQVVYNTSNAFDAVAEFEKLCGEYKDRKWSLEIDAYDLNVWELIKEGETS
jgi:hypothetical protein